MFCFFLTPQVCVAASPSLGGAGAGVGGGGNGGAGHSSRAGSTAAAVGAGQSRSQRLSRIHRMVSQAQTTGLRPPDDLGLGLISGFGSCTYMHGSMCPLEYNKPFPPSVDRHDVSRGRQPGKRGPEPMHPLPKLVIGINPHDGSTQWQHAMEPSLKRCAVRICLSQILERINPNNASN